MLCKQHHLFDLKKGVYYLNGAYMSPQLKSVQKAGIKGMSRKLRPWKITKDEFFEDRVLLKKRFAQLIKANDYQQISLIPSVSYGIANVANNIKLKAKQEIILVDEQFPSNVYTWQRLAKQKGAIITIVKRPKRLKKRGKKWNQKILDAINKKTKVVSMAHVHWADGTLFDLKSIKEKCLKVGAKLIIDGTQSVGALPFSIKDFDVDALVLGGYKWLMGPYSSGVAYYHPDFNEGRPIEENWFNRLHSEDFKNLTQYQEQYQPGAERYSVGESSNFIAVPMLQASIQQILKWKPNRIQKYCAKIAAPSINALREKGCFIEDEKYRAHHLFGVYIPKSMRIEKIQRRLMNANVHVSYRGQAIRVSPHVYNDASDFEKLESLIF